MAKSTTKSKPKAKVEAKSVATSPAKSVEKGKAKETANKKLLFGPGDFVVYPTHGVGRVTSVETQEIAGHKLKLFVISFDQDRMTLRVPVTKATTSGLRKLSSRKMMDTA
ncbi:MAG: CarD family transcriptional regulator, partial [Rhodospirillales bacterium]|nr:CarD family transcriptional regulator [Rhodospirillales bacterium]